MLSPAELTFYKALISVTGTKAIIQSKVRLGDIFKTNTREYKHHNKINQKHIDFLICEAESMKPILGIELDDKSHQRLDRQERDDFVDEVFEMAGLPLLHVPAQREYNVNELAVVIRKTLQH